ncbi:hypothetical protein SUGI_0390670 [Cryptomeria japonica]|nr:hypothetical protein SUGI_0390670 [Cryptomeria japonica]
MQINDGMLGSRTKLAKRFLKKGEKERGELLMRYWGKLVIYMVVYNEIIFHAERLATGGEFLSLVWVMLAHMGYEEQSESIETKKVEMHLDKALTVSARSTRQDPATMQRTLTEREKELDAMKNDLATVKNDLRDSEKELEAMKKVLKDRENDLAAKEKDLSDREKHLAAMEKDLIDRSKEGLSNPEEELATTKKTVSDLQEEVATTRKILRDCMCLYVVYIWLFFLYHLLSVVNISFGF